MMTQVTDSLVSATRPGAWWRWSPGNSLPFFLMLPSLAIVSIVIVFPLIQGLYFSLSDGSLLKPGHFVGLANYARLAVMPDFYRALQFSLIFAVTNVAGCYLLGLGLALLMNMDVPFRGFFRVTLLLPWIVPSVVAIVSWRWMVVDQNAVFNQIVKLFGGRPIYFLASNEWAQFTVILIKMWRSFPFMMLSLLAALQGIDRSLYEAAAIDGAGRWKMFVHITFPQIRNISIILCLLMTIWSVNDFDTPWLLTQGGPANSTENFVLLAIKYTFVRNDLGVGSAISFVTLFVLLAFIVVMLRRQKEPSA